MSRTIIALPKLKSILLYFSNHTNPKFLGKVKLMKLFYFLDFMHLKEYGSPVTYDKYVNLEHGPVPTTIKNLVDTATEDIDVSELADTIYVEVPDNYPMYRILPRRQFLEADKGYFSETEIEMLNKVCLKFGEMNTKQIEDASHLEAPWKETNFLDEIPYTLAAMDPDSKVSKEDIDLLEEIIS